MMNCYLGFLQTSIVFESCSGSSTLIPQLGEETSQESSVFGYLWSIFKFHYERLGPSAQQTKSTGFIVETSVNLYPSIKINFEKSINSFSKSFLIIIPLQSRVIFHSDGYFFSTHFTKLSMH